MNEFDSMNRERKKQQLRRQIVSSEPQGQDYYQEESSENVIKKAHRRVVKKRLILMMVLAVLIGIGAGGWYYYQNYYQFTQYSVAWERELTKDSGAQESSFAGYARFGDNILKYTKDGASYINGEGKAIWVQTYEMKSPVAVVNGDYAAIADENGNSIYICNTEGCQGVATTLLPILKVTVSSKGVVAAIQEDAKANYITFFKKDGSTLDIAIKSKLTGDGYPLSLSFSPDGTQLICSYIYVENSAVNSKVIFYNFSEIGKNASANRVVGGFHEQFAGQMVPKVQFLSELDSFACSDQGLAFFSSKNLGQPQMLSLEKFPEEIESVFYSPEYVGVILMNGEGDNPYRMEIFKADGTKVLSQPFDFQYTHAVIERDMVILFNEDSCQVYNIKGTLKFEQTFDFPVSYITAGSLPDRLIITGPQKMREIKLK